MPGKFLSLAAITILLATAGCSLQRGQSWTSALPGVGSEAGLGSDALSDDPVLTNTDLVRAPEVFAASGYAKWDGRRTARGVWVAHPRVKGTLPVRIVHNGSGVEVDGKAYRAQGLSADDVIAVSSDTAEALKLERGAQERLSIFALRARPGLAGVPEQSAEEKARAELAAHIGGLDHPALLQLVGAAVRGMGYATTFERGDGGSPDTIRALALPGSGPLPTIRVDVRTGTDDPINRAEFSAFRQGLSSAGEIGVLVSIAGFEGLEDRAQLAGGAHVEMVDLETLIDIWVTHYPALAEADRNLLRLRPVYVLASTD